MSSAEPSTVWKPTMTNSFPLPTRLRLLVKRRQARAGRLRQCRRTTAPGVDGALLPGRRHI